MKDETLLRIASRVRPLSPAANLRRMAYEEGGGFYDAWRIADGPETYLLKAAGRTSSLSTAASATGWTPCPGASGPRPIGTRPISFWSSWRATT